VLCHVVGTCMHVRRMSARQVSLLCKYLGWLSPIRQHLKMNVHSASPYCIVIEKWWKLPPTVNEDLHVTTNECVIDFTEVKLSLIGELNSHYTTARVCWTMGRILLSVLSPHVEEFTVSDTETDVHYKTFTILYLWALWKPLSTWILIILYHFNHLSLVVTVCATRRNSKECCFLPTMHIYQFHVILRVNGNHFIKQH
jgi:hypothetical protein